MLRKSVTTSFALIAVSALMSAAPARADGSLKDDPLPAPSSDYIWDGLYVGAGIGAGSFDHDVKVDTSDRRKSDCFQECFDLLQVQKEHMGLVPQTFGNNDWDAFGTLQVGYDRLIDNRILIGAFADVDFYPDSESNFSTSPEKYMDEATLAAMRRDGRDGLSIDGNLSLNHVWHVGGRLGFLMRPDFLLFATGGYTQANLDGSLNVSMGGFERSFNGPRGISLSMPDNLDGWFIGGGGEVKLDRNLSLKFEYRYANYDGESVTASSNRRNGDYLSFMSEQYKMEKMDVRADVDAEIHSVRAVLVFKLGEPEHEVVPLK